MDIFKLGDKILDLRNVIFAFWNNQVSLVFALLGQSPTAFKDGKPWDVIEGLEPVFVAVGSSLVVLFFVIGFCSESIDIREEMRFEVILISLIVGGGIVLLTYPYVGLTTSAYIAIPVVAPIALTGFYSYNGMTFVEMMKLKLHFAFGNRTLTYISTEGQMTDISSDQAEKGKQKKAVSTDNKGDFKKAQKKMILMMVLMAVFIAAVGVAAYWYKYLR